MDLIRGLAWLSQVTLYVLLALMMFFGVVVFYWQIMVIRGKSMKNADGSTDDWHDQSLFYGIAFADIVLACPATLAGVALTLIGSRWGFYMLALVASWFLWANTMTTANSLKFEKPKITLSWIITFPAEILIGAGYILWTIIHFDVIYGF